MPWSELGHFNPWAAIVAGLAAFFIGGIWYSGLFGKAWVKAQGFTDEQVAQMKAKMKPPIFFGGMIFAYIVLGFALEIIIWRMNIQATVGGMKVGAVAFLIVASVTLTHHLASNKVWAAYLIDASCELVYLLVMGAILGSWR
jgi:hypothetical protein